VSAEVRASAVPDVETIITPEATDFLASLHRSMRASDLNFSTQPSRFAPTTVGGLRPHLTTSRTAGSRSLARSIAR
jgi:hypothetical protein